jgi:hypothetical protein
VFLRNFFKTETMSNITPTTYPSTPLDKAKDISSHLETLLAGNQQQSQTPASANDQTPPSDTIRELIQCFRRQQTAIDALATPPPSPFQPTLPRYMTSSTPDYFNNAKYEDIICRPIKPQYDGAPDTLVRFLNRLDLRRHDENWGTITYIILNGKKYDFICHFSQIPESDVLREAKFRWKVSTVTKDKHTMSHPTFNVILGKLLLNSLMNDFSITIVNRIPTTLCNDGPYFSGLYAITFIGIMWLLSNPSNTKSELLLWQTSAMILVPASSTSKTIFA